MPRRLPLTAFLLILLILATITAASGFTTVPRAQAQDAPSPLATPTPEFPEPVPTPPPPQPVSAAPAIIAEQYPAPGAIVHVQPPIYLVFAEPMDRASVEAALSIQPPVPYSTRWQENVLHIDLDQPLDPGPQYVFALDASAQRADGTPTGEFISWQYDVRTVASFAEEPTDGNTRIRLHFDTPLHQRDAEETLRIEPEYWREGQRVVPIDDFAWSDDGLALTVDLGEPLALGESYVARFDAGPGGLMRDANEMLIYPPTVAQFTVPSPIVLLTPSRHDSAPPNVVLRATFEQPIEETLDQSTLEGSFVLSPTVAGDLRVEGHDLIFTPAEPLAAGATYTATIATSLLAASGEPLLPQPYSWTFYTNQPEPAASFGYGPNAQVLDADGRRAVQFDVRSQQPVTLGFQLYGLTREQFLDRYASGFRGVAGVEDKPIAVDDLPLVANWREETPNFGEDNYFRVIETQLPQEVPAGLYVLNVSGGADAGIAATNADDQLIVLLTRNVITLKQAEGEITAWVTDINATDDSGIAGASVGVYARDGSLLAEGITNGDGLVTIEVETNPQPLIVIARRGDDFTATGLNNEWRSAGGGWWSWWQPQPEARKHSVHLYTDRPIYKPGQTVHYKAIVRGDDDAIIQPAQADLPVTLRIRDARDNVVQTVELTTNDFGTVHGDFVLAEGAMLGEYAVEIALDGSAPAPAMDAWMLAQVNAQNPLRQAFKVEEYHKPDYSVDVSTDAARYVSGDTIRVSVDTSYLFGEPVANARLTLRQFELGYNWWGFSRNPANFHWSGPSGDDLTGTTDGSGRYTFTIPAQAEQRDGPYYWYAPPARTFGLEISAQDGSGQSVSSFATVEIYSAAEQVDVQMDSYAQPVEEPITAEVRVTDLSDEPVAGRKLSVRLEPWTHWSFSIDESTLEAADAQTLVTDAEGRADVSLVAERAGSYRLLVESEDARGNEITVERWLYLVGEEDNWYANYGDQSVLEVAADRETYAPGDVAEIVVESSFSGPALLTVERGTLRRTQPVNLTAPLTTVELPIEPGDAPNVFVSVQSWEAQSTELGETQQRGASLPDSALRLNTVELSVPVTEKRLDVEITPSKQTFAPREQGQFTVRVTDSAGNPVRAELSAALVDESIYLLSEELSGPIFDSFYAAREHRVYTFDGLALRRWFGGRGGGGGGGIGPTNPRSDFPDTAVWLPTIETDDNGEAVIEVDFADTLTSWRLTVKAVTAEETLVGEATANVETQQAIVVRPLLPQGLTASDSATVSALVHNYSDGEQTLGVSLHSDALNAEIAVDADLTQTVTLAPDASQVVGWPIQVDEAGDYPLIVAAQPVNLEEAYFDRSVACTTQPSGINQAAAFGATNTTCHSRGEPAPAKAWGGNPCLANEVTFAFARTTDYLVPNLPSLHANCTDSDAASASIRAAGIQDDLRDAVQLTLTVRPLAVADVSTQVGSFTDTLETEISLPPDALDLSTVTVTLNRSIAGSLLDGLDYLTGYPYGCVEQTMSRALPNAVVGRAFEQLGVADSTLAADLPPLINAGLQRLYGFQHNDGGWGWWYDDRTDAYQTAWVLFGLSVTREAGYEVDAGVIERGAAWLAQELARNPSDERLDPRTRAFALYSLVYADTEPEATRLEAAQLLAKREDLDAFSQAALALTLHRLGDADGAQAIVDALAETATVENGEAWWPVDDDSYQDRRVMASATRSTALALSAFVQIRPDHPLQGDIVRWLMGQRRQQGWGNTNETAFAIIALTDHLVAQQADAPRSGYRLLLNGDELATGTLDRDEPVITLDIPADALETGDNALVVEQTSGDGPLYYVIHQRTLLGEAEIEAAGTVDVQRRYLDLAGEEVSSVEAGELVDVELTVNVPETSFYVIIEDALPGGLEALNERLNTTSHVADADQEQFYWRGLGYNHKEIRDGRVSFFVTELEPGQHVITYKARATHPGDFVAMPAEAYAMYDETTWGRSASGVLVVE